MKYILQIMAVLIFANSSPLISQTVITKADFQLKANYESQWYESAQPDLEAPAVGENQIWDLSNLDVQLVYNTEFFDASGDDFYKDAINYQNTRYALNDFLFESTDFYAIDDEGYAKIGRRLAETDFSITELTGGSTDNLKIVGGNSPFEGRWDYIKFPLKYEDSWTFNFKMPTNYELTIESYELKDTPGLFMNHITESREVVGSGELTMPNKDGGVMTIDALLIKVERTVIDSVFLGGQPAPPQLMAAFGLLQGGIATRETYVFYSAGYGESVASYDITDGNITYKSLTEITSSVETEELNTLNVYPNPVKIGSSIAVDNTNNNISSISIVDQTGKIVYSNEFANLNANITLEIPNTLTTGVYLLQSNNRQGELVNTTKLIIE